MRFCVMVATSLEANFAFSTCIPRLNKILMYRQYFFCNSEKYDNIEIINKSHDRYMRRD